MYCTKLSCPLSSAYLILINVDGRDLLVVPNVTSVGLDVTLTDNDQLIAIDLAALASAGGNITISGNLTLQSIDMSSLATVGSSLSITNNPALNALLISGVTSIGGDLTVLGTTATIIDMSSLTTVTGSVNVSGNTSATTIDISNLATSGGSVTVSGNASANIIDMSSLATSGGSVTISGNTSVGSLDISSLTSAGSVDVSGNTSATIIDMSGLATSGGSVTISGNTSATAINMGGLTSVGGGLTVVANGGAAVDMSAGTDVAGSVTIETTGTGAFPMGGGTVAGELTLDATGYTDISGTTPVGSLDLTATNSEAVMHLQIQAATFSTPVSFSLTRLDPIALAPESGLDGNGSPATIDPIAAYQFTFAVPTLNRDAALSFDINFAQLDTATQTALLDAIAAGTATIVTKGDAADSVFQAFPICVGAQAPTVDGCVKVEAFDALGQPTSGTPAIVRFSNVVGHFSTWAVAIVTQANRTEICSTLGNNRFLDIDIFEFNGVKGKQVIITLAPNPAGTFTPGKAALALFDLGLLKLDTTVLPNAITATLPRTGKYFVTVAELLLKTGKFKGDYCVSVESTQNAWQTFHK